MDLVIQVLETGEAPDCEHRESEPSSLLIFRTQLDVVRRTSGLSMMLLKHLQDIDPLDRMSRAPVEFLLPRNGPDIQPGYPHVPTAADRCVAFG